MILLKSFKMKVTPEQSKFVQERLFKLGCFWSFGSIKRVQHTQNPFLYLNDHVLTSGITIGSFNLYDNIPEITFEEFEKFDRDYNS